MKIKEALINGGKEITYINAKIIMKYVLNKPENYLVINSEENLTKKNEESFFEFVDKIKKGTPLQYITNEQEFMGEKFFVNEDVLIPQPDTEILVEKAIEFIKNYDNKKENIKVLDLCTGSGAIAISIKKYLDMININSEIIASDISEKAIKIAKKNADKILADNNIKFIKSDLFEDMDDYSNEDYRFDFIISNPPYIETDIISNLATDVQKEPLIALDGGKDGLKFYREINKNIKNYLKADGYLLLEIGYDQKKNVMDIFKGSECIKDYTGNDRVIIWKN